MLSHIRFLFILIVSTNYKLSEKSGKRKLIVIDLARYYVNVMVGNLESLNLLKKELIFKANKDANRKNKHIRLTSESGTCCLRTSILRNTLI